MLFTLNNSPIKGVYPFDNYPTTRLLNNSLKTLLDVKLVLVPKILRNYSA